jgi:hypothetical protein
VNESHAGVGHGHLAEHAHHQDHQDPSGEIRHHGARAHAADHPARADEQAGPDDPAESDHRHVTWLQTALELGALLV